MNINVINDLDIIRLEHPNVNFEVVDDLLYNQHKYLIDIEDIRNLLDILSEQQINDKKIKIYANDIITLSKKQFRDIKQDRDSVYFFMKGFTLDGLDYENKRLSNGRHFCYESTECVLPNRRYFQIDNQYPGCEYGGNIFSLFVRDNSQTIFVYNEIFTWISEFINSVNSEDNSEQGNAIDSIKATIVESVEKEINNQLSLIDDISERISNVQEELKQLLKNKREAEQKLRTLSSNKQKKIESFMSIIANGTKIKGVKSVSLLDNCTKINIETDNVYVKSMGYTFYMGRYLATVHLNDTRVSFTNLEPEHRRRSYWSGNDMHPHISNNGTPCLGNIAESIMVAIKNVDIKSMCVIILSYLSSVNPGDAAGKFLTNWDVVDETGKIIDFPEELKDCHSCGSRVTELTKDNFHICHDCGKNYCHNHCESKQIRHNHEIIDTYLCTSCSTSYVQCAECCAYTKNTYRCPICGEMHCEDCSTRVQFLDNKGVRICNKCYEKIKEGKSSDYSLLTCCQCGQEKIIEYNENSDILGYVCDRCKENQCCFCKKPIDKRHILTEFGEKLCVDCWKETDRCDVCLTLQLKDNLTYNNINNTKRCKDGCRNTINDETTLEDILY